MPGSSATRRRRVRCTSTTTAGWSTRAAGCRRRWRLTACIRPKRDIASWPRWPRRRFRRRSGGRSPAPASKGAELQPPRRLSAGSPHRLVATEWVAGERLRVQRAAPLPVATYPHGRIVRLDRQRLAVHDHALLHWIRDDRDVIGQETDLAGLFVEGVVLQLPRPFGRHLRHHLRIDRGDALRADDDALLVRQVARGGGVLLLHRVPELPLYIHQF